MIVNCFDCGLEIEKKGTEKRCPSCRQKYRKKYNTEWNRLRAQKDIPKYLWTVTKDRANRSDLDFNIEITDIVVPDLCPVFNIPLVYMTPYSASVDRIDPSKGYVKGNIQVISRKANIMKNNATQKELEMFAEWAKTFALS